MSRVFLGFLGSGNRCNRCFLFAGRGTVFAVSRLVGTATPGSRQCQLTGTVSSVSRWFFQLQRLGNAGSCVVGSFPASDAPELVSRRTSRCFVVPRTAFRGAPIEAPVVVQRRTGGNPRRCFNFYGAACGTCGIAVQGAPQRFVAVMGVTVTYYHR